MKKKYKKIPISEFISDKKLRMIEKSIDKVIDVETAYDKIETILSKDFKIKDLGTNRIILVHKNKKYKDLIFKVAGDKHGIEANYREFYNGDLDHALTYSYSISSNGIFIVQEKVKAMKSDDMKKHKKEVRKMLAHLSKKILLVDCKMSNFKNFGIRDNGEVCLLDHGDTVPLKKCQDENIVNIDEESAVSLRCKKFKDITSDKLKICGGKLEYSKNYDYLICQKCGAIMAVHDAYKELYNEDHSDVNMTKELIKNLDFDPYEWKEEVKKYCIDTMSNVNINNDEKGEQTMKTKVINNQECKQLKGFWVPTDVLNNPKYVMLITAVKTNQMKPADLFQQLHLNPEDYKVRAEDHETSDWKSGMPVVINTILKKLEEAVKAHESYLVIPYDDLATDKLVIDSINKEKTIFTALKGNTSDVMSHVTKIIYTKFSFNFSLTYTNPYEDDHADDDYNVDPAELADSMIDELDEEVEKTKELRDYDYTKITQQILMEIVNSTDRKDIPSLHKHSVNISVKTIGQIFYRNDELYDDIFSENNLFRVDDDTNSVIYNMNKIANFIDTFCDITNLSFIDTVEINSTTSFRFVFDEVSNDDENDENDIEEAEYDEVETVAEDVIPDDCIHDCESCDDYDCKNTPNDLIDGEYDDDIDSYDDFETRLDDEDDDEDYIDEDDSEDINEIESDDSDDDEDNIADIDEPEDDTDSNNIIRVIESIQDNVLEEILFDKDNTLESYLAKNTENDSEMSMMLQAMDIFESDASDYTHVQNLLNNERSTVKMEMIKYSITHVRETQSITYDDFMKDMRAKFISLIGKFVKKIQKLTVDFKEEVDGFLEDEFQISEYLTDGGSQNHAFSWIYDLYYENNMPEEVSNNETVISENSESNTNNLKEIISDMFSTIEMMQPLDPHANKEESYPIPMHKESNDEADNLNINNDEADIEFAKNVVPIIKKLRLSLSTINSLTNDLNVIYAKLNREIALINHYMNWDK